MASDSSGIDLSFYKRLLWTSRKFLVSTILIFGLLGALAFAIKKTYFIAKSSLMIQNAGGLSGGGIGAYMQIAQQFGLMGGGGMGLDEDQAVDILKSRRIITEALLKYGVVNGRKELLANHYIEVLDLRASFKKDARLQAFKFTHSDSKQLTFLEDSLLNDFYVLISKKHLQISKQLKSGIINIEFKSRNEVFSKLYSEELIHAMEDFYIHNKTENDRLMVDVLDYKLDSVVTALHRAEDRLAHSKDVNKQVVKATGLLDEMRLRRDVEILNVLYSEVIKNDEMAKFKLLINTPIVQIIDSPVLPLEDNEVNWWMGLLLGMLLGLFAGAGLIVIYHRLTEKSKQQIQ